MSDQSAVKHISIKYPGTGKGLDVLDIEPGTRVSDVFRSLGIDAGYHLVDPQAPDTIYRATDDLYARVDDGQVLAAMAKVDAGMAA